MTGLESLQHYAHSQHIGLQEDYFESQHKGFSVVSPYTRAVAINKRLVTDSIEYLCTLAEEIGHVRTDTVLPVNAYIDPAFLKWLKLKNEMRATRYAIRQLVPAWRIRMAIAKGYYSTRNIAIFCGITEELLGKALAYYEQRQVYFY
ncbi:MAG: hypothetical protein FWF98_02565 [Dehalococcoidia bacterium]|nr:hypothetical protein [Dehalococcoidia bacterium]